MINFIFHHPRANYAMLGFLPDFFSERDPRPAKEQADTAYRHGGGWHSFPGHRVSEDKMSLHYPGDPPMRCLASATLRDERIFVYECSWVMIMQKDGSYEIARMD